MTYNSTAIVTTNMIIEYRFIYIKEYKLLDKYMKSDACYKNLEVKNNIVANTIFAKKINLEDTTLQSNIMMLGERIKTLYEQQRDTHAYCDADKQYVDLLQKLLDVQNCLFKQPVFFPIAQLDVDVPNNCYCICASSNNAPILKSNVNGSISYTVLQKLEERVNLNVAVDEDKMSVSTLLNTTIG